MQNNPNPYCEETVASMTDEQLQEALNKQYKELHLAELLERTIRISIKLIGSERTKRKFGIPIGSVVKVKGKLATVVGYSSESLIAKLHKKDGSVGEREIHAYQYCHTVEVISKP